MIQRDAMDFVHEAYCTCHSTLHARELPIVNDSDEAMPIQLSEFELTADIMSGEQCMKPFWKLHLKSNTVSE